MNYTFISILKELEDAMTNKAEYCHNKAIKGKIILGEITEKRNITVLYFQFYFLISNSDNS